jgi:hypothetical protein
VTVAFRATLNSVPQPPVPARAYAKVGFHHAEFNLGGGFDATTSRFTAPIAGYYSVHACAWFLEIAPGVLISTAIYRNGKPCAHVGMANGANVACGLCVSDVLKLDAGDSLEVHVVHDSAGPRLLATGSADAYFSGCLIAAA